MEVLNLDLGIVESSPSQDHSDVKVLAEKIGVDSSTIRNRINLLVLPESIQAMVENKTLTIRPAEIIVRLRQLEDRKSAEAKMKEHLTKSLHTFRFEEIINMVRIHVFRGKMDEEELQENSEIDLHLKKKEVVRKLAELSHHEEELVAKEADLKEWHQKLSQRENEIENKEEHLSTWEKELRKIAAQVAEEKRRIDATVEPARTSVSPSDERVSIKSKEKITGKAESLPKQDEPIQEEPIEEKREEEVHGSGSLKEAKEKKRKRFGLFR